MRAQEKIQTNIVGLVKDYNGVFTYLFGNLLCYFWIQQVVKRVDDNIHKRHLRGRSGNNSNILGIVYHSSNCEVRTHAIIPTILEDICQGPNAGRYKAPGVKLSKVLWEDGQHGPTFCLDTETRLMPVAQIHRAWVLSSLFANCRIRKITTSCIYNFAFLFFRDLDGAYAAN